MQLQKILTIFILTILFLSTIITIPISSISTKTYKTTESGSGNTIYVDDDADPSWYNDTHVQTIQKGVDIATDGDTVFVYNGTYYENVYIEKSIDLIGESKEKTIIDGQGLKANLFFYHSNIKLSTFKLKNKGKFSSIHTTSDNSTIFNNIFTDDAGINIESNNNQIFNNYFVNNNYESIYLYGGNNNISGNIFENNSKGIVINWGLNRISNNIINNSLKGIVHYTGSNYINNNQISNCSKYAIQLNNECTIKYNKILNNNVSIYILSDCYSNISYNIIRNNFFSIRTEGPYSRIRIPTSIYRNNFIDNQKCEFLFHAKYFKNNFWDDWITFKIADYPIIISLLNKLSKIIFPIINSDEYQGKIPYHIPGTPNENPGNNFFINFDWDPATEPHEINIGGVN